ncbi:unnamed protein product [Sphenostylis stenocarpa]|uniref:Protein RDM1 n=1 Tax=Sphenostylis stenocarpa TaxID=92480 RepID=A0AA86S144_9FABA|nr:unnamed protein product [Sphenostylis stenocarpa]
MLVSDSETESDDNLNNVAVAVTVANADGGAREEEGKKSLSAHKVGRKFNTKQSLDPDALLEVAREYQKQMEKKPVPTHRLNHDIVVVNWKGLGKTLKTLYGEPLHYLTQNVCKEWDKSRFGSENEEKPLNVILSWREAEDTVWKVEAVHRLCTSPVHLAMLWLHDPEYHVFLDEVVSTPSTSTK